MVSKKALLILFLSLSLNFMSGQQLFKDIFPTSTDAFPVYPFPFCNSNGLFFFDAIGSYSVGNELWKSDGTTSGTVLVKDIAPGTNTSFVNNLTNVNGTLFFRACTDGNNYTYELWKSDGTTSGTIMVKDIYPGTFGSDPQNFISFKGSLFFTADNGVNGVELWKSDGTEIGTLMVKDIYQGSISGNPKTLTLYNNELYFQASAGYSGSNTGETLWKTDGTTAGTVPVSPSNKPGYPEELVVCNNLLFFSATGNTAGRELWKTDGTNAGTMLVKDVYPGATNNGFPRKLIDVNGQLFFFATNGTLGFELWKSDGTTAGTIMIKDIKPGANGSFVGTVPDNYTTCSIDSELYFRADDGVNGAELWKSDGTSSGTIMIKDIYPGVNSSFPKAFINFKGKLYFGATDNVNGIELWKSDGTEAGTVLLKDINEGSSGSIPYAMHIFNNNLYFSAGTFQNGRELWSYNGNDLGINDVKSNKLNVNLFPNPTSTILTISMDDNSTIDSIFITDLTGKKLLEKTGNTTSINIENLANGMYLIQVFSGKDTFQTKFIKK
jgi:ELWxxDGT repeat protein